MAYHGKKLTELKGDARAARIKQLLANPGTRKLVPDADLPSSYRAQRQLNARLNAPIVAGSSTTNRDLAHQREAAVTTQFGPNAVGAQQFREKQTAGWFDEYQRQLEQARKNVVAGNDQAQGQIANLGNVTGPTGSSPQDAGNQDVAAKAQAIRSTLLGAQKGQLLGQGQASSTYANTLANVVAPGEKVQALSQAAGATDALKQKIGAFRTQYEGDARTNESKNVLAAQALNLNTAKVAGVNPITGKPNPPSASDQKTQADIDYFNKHGYYPTTGPPKKPAAKTGYGAGAPGLNKYGYTYDEWTALGSKKQAAVRAGKGTKPGDPATADAKAFYAKYGVKPAATDAINNATTTIQSTSTLIKQIRASNPGMTRQQIGQLLLTGQSGSTKKGSESIAIPKTPGLWATVALDLWQFHGKVSAGTANRLHKAGYSVKTLGLATVPSVSTRPPTASGVGGQQRPT